MPPRRKERLKPLTKKTRAEKKAERSHGGFVVAALAFCGAVAASMWCATSCAAPSLPSARQTLLCTTRRRVCDVLARLLRGVIAAELDNRRRSAVRCQLRRCDRDARLLTASTTSRTQVVRTRLSSKPLVYSEHAACRMDCRHVTSSDVHAALARGRLDDRRVRLRHHTTAVICPVCALARLRAYNAAALRRARRSRCRAHAMLCRCGHAQHSSHAFRARLKNDVCAQEAHHLAVFADCQRDTRLVTVIDTATDHPCGPC